MLPLGHRTPHHTKCVSMCVNCSRRFRGTKFVCFLCLQMQDRAMDIRRWWDDTSIAR